MKAKDTLKLGLGVALVGGGAYIAYRLLYKPPEGEKGEKVGIEVTDIVLQDPSGQRIVAPGGGIHVVVAFKNISVAPVSVRFRLPLSAAGAPLWHRTVVGDGNEDWQRTPIIAPGDSISFDVGYSVPMNWSPGWAVSVRLDLDGVGTIAQWDHAFDIVSGPTVADMQNVQVEYSVV